MGSLRWVVPPPPNVATDPAATTLGGTLHSEDTMQHRTNAPDASHGMARLVLCTLVAALAVLAGCSLDDNSGPILPLDPELLTTTSAETMAAVESVRFRLEASGDPVFIDPLRTLALVDVEGRFVVPAKADALLTVEVNESLRTQLGAIAIEDAAWLSNPITGVFEPLPESYGLDPSRFFDPENGWRPLIENLTDVVAIETDDRGHHVRAIATGDDIRRVTAGLAARQDTPVELWLDIRTAAVVRAEFDTSIDGATTTWVLELDDYGTDVTIEPPDLDG